MSKNVKGVNNVDFRRTWDKGEFFEKAKEREEKVRLPHSLPTAPLHFSPVALTPLLAPHEGCLALCSCTGEEGGG